MKQIAMNNMNANTIAVVIEILITISFWKNDSTGLALFRLGCFCLGLVNILDHLFCLWM